MREYTNLEKMFFLLKQKPMTKKELADRFKVTIKTIENIKAKHPDVFIYSKKKGTYELMGFIPRRIPSILIYELVTIDIDNEKGTNLLSEVVSEVKKELVLTSTTGSTIQHLLCSYFLGQNRFNNVGYS